MAAAHVKIRKKMFWKMSLIETESLRPGPSILLQLHFFFLSPNCRHYLPKHKCSELRCSNKIYLVSVWLKGTILLSILLTSVAINNEQRPKERERGTQNQIIWVVRSLNQGQRDHGGTAAALQQETDQVHRQQDGDPHDCLWQSLEGTWGLA